MVSGGVPGIELPLFHFGTDGRLLEAWGDPPKTDNFVARLAGSGGPLHATSEGLIYSQAAPHHIVWFDYPIGNLGEEPPVAHILAEMPHLLEHPGDDVVVESGSGANWSRSYYPNYPQSRDVFMISSGQILNVVLYRDDGYSLWQIFGQAVEEGGSQRPLLTEIRVSEPWFPWVLCDDGTILATREDEDGLPIIARLRLE